MKCERCPTVELVNLGEVKCATGDADRMGCPKCSGIWFRQKKYGPTSGEWTPLRATLERILNEARADAVRTASAPVATSFPKATVGEYCI